MKKTKKLIALTLALLTLTAILTGCAGGKDGVKETPKPSETSPTTSAAVEGGEITVAIAQDLDESLDPHKMVAAGTREVLFNVFEGLLKPTSDGNLIPAVASDYTVSDTVDTFTFTLRKGVRFHNGEEVTVGDVLYSLRRCAGIPDGDPLISAFSAVKSVEAPDDRTVVIKLAGPDLEFAAYLTAAIIPEGYDEQETAPVGTGPFRYVSRAPQDNIVLEKFEEYWGDAAHLDKVTFRIIENPETLMMALKGGSVDFLMRLTEEQKMELGEEAFYYENSRMNLVQAVYLNNAVEPLDNADVRRALSYALNRQEIFDFAGEKAYPVGSSMYPGLTKYFMPELADYYEYDPEKAKELLADAGYPDGFDLEITAPSNHKPHVDTAEIVAQQLQAVGINATIRLVEWSTWLSDVYQGRNYEATVVGVEASAMTARAMLERFISTASGNFINFNNSEYDSVFEHALAATSEREQVEFYKRLQKILTEEAANLYIRDLTDIIALKKNLTGYKMYPLYVLDLSTLQLLEK